jgi:hypothetical protein
LLAGENVRIAECRNEHFLYGGTRDWPAFSAGSQGDFACYLLSGLAKVARLLGYKGFVVVLDEMEKWQELNWRQQTRAANLIGGLIWGATEQAGKRQRGTWGNPNPHQPEQLEHSGRAGGFPFTTPSRCHIGVVIALTPRGDEGPEGTWQQFGSLNMCELPEFTVHSFKRYVPLVAKLYRTAYDLPEANLIEITAQALTLWRGRSEESARVAVQSAIEALDVWRNSL